MGKIKEMLAESYEELKIALKPHISKFKDAAISPDDLIHDAMHRLLKAYGNRDIPIENLSGLLYTTIKNYKADIYRKRARQQKSSGKPPKPRVPPDSQDAVSAHRRRLNLVSEDDLMKLRGRTLQIYQLRDEGYTHAEIAKLMTVSKSTVEKEIGLALLTLSLDGRRGTPRAK
jgi:RNA polymerase sigma factor (sigma-70 family)